MLLVNKLEEDIGLDLCKKESRDFLLPGGDGMLLMVDVHVDDNIMSVVK